MKVVSIDLSLIDFNDLTLFTGYKEDISSIQDSIREIGIINPPILMHKGEGYQIITGWKRLISSRKLGHTQALCSVYGSGEISDKECIKIIYQDNRATMSELELAELIMLFRDLCSPDDKELINNVLPLFGIPPSRKHLDKIISLSSLQKEIKDSFYTGGITIEQAQMLSELTPENRGPILLDVILKYRLNKNESRQVIGNIEEITLRDQKSVIEVINEVENAMDDNKKGKNELRQQLKRLRYPALSKVEEEYKRQLDNLNLPREVNIFVHQYFEGNDLEFRIKVNSAEDLLKISSYLESLCTKGDIERLISLITKGE